MTETAAALVRRMDQRDTARRVVELMGEYEELADDTARAHEAVRLARAATETALQAVREARERLVHMERAAGLEAVLERLRAIR